MPYTRRSMLRDAALVSLAGSPFALLGCKKKSPAITQPTPAYAGVRVFFSGSWIFCSDGNKANPGMYAMARDMQMDPDYPNRKVVPHKFPYGIWNGGSFDDNADKLLPNPVTTGTTSPYTIALSGYSPTISVSTLFQNAYNSSSFNYLRNADSAHPMTIDVSSPGLLRISLPIPTRIVPAAFLAQAVYQQASSGPSFPPPPQSQGLATTHIFEYDQATLLTFSQGTSQITMQPDSHFHIHTVPDEPHSTKDVDHGPDMFLNMLQAIQWNQKRLSESGLSLNDPTPTDIRFGPYVLADMPNISSEELEFKYLHPTLTDLASCSGSGFGIDGTL
jgi:hypothetical protein